MEPFPSNIWATNFTVPSKIGQEDQLSSYPTPMVQKGAELLVKN